MDTSPRIDLLDDLRDGEDFKRLHNAIEPSGRGFLPLLQSPMLFTREGHNVVLGDMFRGQSAFLVAAGPSLATIDLNLLRQRGVLTLAVNNAAAIVRPNLWCCVDDPGDFVDAIWRDPGITKFVPLAHMEKRIIVRDTLGQLTESEERVGDMPAVFGFRRNEAYVAERFLHEPSFNWGNHGDRSDAYGLKGGRSVMYVALKLLYYLGVRTIYLVGCDFRMSEGTAHYAFNQDRSQAAIRNNNYTYEAFNTRMRHLLPHLEQAGCTVINTTANSGLTAFPHVSLNEAVQSATKTIPTRIDTAGMYDRQAREREAARKAKTAARLRIVTDRNLAAGSSSLTVVVPLECKVVKSFPSVFEKWQRTKRWLRQIPVIFLTPQGSSACKACRKRISAFKNVRVVPVDVGGGRRSEWERIKTKTIPALIDTEWHLVIDPTVIPAGADTRLVETLCAPMNDSSTPVFLSSSATAPTSSESQLLEAWGRGVAAFNVQQQAAVQFRGAEQQPLGGDFFLGQTDWCRRIATYVGESLPCESHIDYVRYCAGRLGRPFAVSRIEECGWARGSNVTS